MRPRWLLGQALGRWGCRGRRFLQGPSLQVRAPGLGLAAAHAPPLPNNQSGRKGHSPEAGRTATGSHRGLDRLHPHAQRARAAITPRWGNSWAGGMAEAGGQAGAGSKERPALELDSLAASTEAPLSGRSPSVAGSCQERWGCHPDSPGLLSALGWGPWGPSPHKADLFSFVFFLFFPSFLSFFLSFSVLGIERRAFALNYIAVLFSFSFLSFLFFVFPPPIYFSFLRHGLTQLLSCPGWAQT